MLLLLFPLPDCTGVVPDGQSALHSPQTQDESDDLATLPTESFLTDNPVVEPKSEADVPLLESKEEAQTRNPPRHRLLAKSVFSLNVSVSSYETHWLLSQTTSFTPAALLSVTVAPEVAMIFSISGFAKMPDVAVHCPGFPPPENGQPAVLHEGSERVKERLYACVLCQPRRDFKGKCITRHDLSDAW